MAKRMSGRAAAMIVTTCLIPPILSGCSTAHTNARASQIQADLQAPVAKSGAQLQRFNLKDWTAPNDHTLLLVANDGTRYRAEMLGPCQGLDFAHALAFVNRGGFNTIDRYSTVVLNDGTRCAFQTFDQLKSAESKALDDYEKAGEKPQASPTDDSKPK